MTGNFKHADNIIFKLPTHQLERVSTQPGKEISTWHKGEDWAWSQLSQDPKIAIPVNSETRNQGPVTITVCLKYYTRFSQRSRFGSTGPPSWHRGHQNKPIRSSGCKRSGDAGTSWYSSLSLIGQKLNSVAPSTRIGTFGWTDYISPEWKAST